MRAEIVNPSDTALDELKFSLWANAYAENAVHAPVPTAYTDAAYYDGEKSFGGITVSAVEGAESFRVEGEEENILGVRLKQPLAAGESVSLTITFETRLAKINHRLGVGEHVVNLSGFYPVLCRYDGGFLTYGFAEVGDPFVSDCADYRVSITLPESYGVYGGGTFQRTQDGGKAVNVFVLENVREAAFVIGTGFKVVKEETEAAGKRVSVEYVYFRDDNPHISLSVAKNSLCFYAERFGAYPHSRYLVVQTDLCCGGMEFPSLSMISATISDAELPFTIAHETAHQWWYASVGSNQYGAAWQDEGLAEFCAALYMEETGVYYRNFVSRCERNYRAYCSVKEQTQHSVNTAMARSLTDFSGVYEYRTIVYDKSVILFDRLRSLLGEKKLLSALKKYSVAFAGHFADTEDFLSFFPGTAAQAVRSFVEGDCIV